MHGRKQPHAAECSQDGRQRLLLVGELFQSTTVTLAQLREFYSWGAGLSTILESGSSSCRAKAQRQGAPRGAEHALRRGRCLRSPLAHLLGQRSDPVDQHPLEPWYVHRNGHVQHPVIVGRVRDPAILETLR